MRYAVIMAGGSGTRLWPMSRKKLPKQLVPLGEGKSLLEYAFERAEALVEPERIYVCAASEHREAIARALPRLKPENFLGEPIGRDTLSAVGFAAAVIAIRDPAAAIGVFPADHLIRPLDRFREAASVAYELVERGGRTLVTFGIVPAAPATAYGYLELGEAVEGSVRRVARFQEKPDRETALEYLREGPERYLWNAGIFVWRAETILDCIRRYEPEVFRGLQRIAAAWKAPERGKVLAEVYPTLKKISIDYAVMEPASRDPALRLLAVPLDVEWIDVGSWNSFAACYPKDGSGNALGCGRYILLDTRGTLVASSDPGHLIAAVGCEDLIIVHTPDATLVCRASEAEKVKQLYEQVVERFGEGYL